MPVNETAIPVELIPTETIITILVVMFAIGLFAGIGYALWKIIE